MIFLKTKYITIFGVKEVIEIPIKKSTQWLIYQKDTPAYFVDLYNLEKESNVIMNSLVLCSEKPIREVLRLINKANKIHLSISTVSRWGFKIILKSDVVKLNLEPIPEKWLSYSL
jgi:hypothetical protein